MRRNSRRWFLRNGLLIPSGALMLVPKLAGHSLSSSVYAASLGKATAVISLRDGGLPQLVNTDATATPRNDFTGYVGCKFTVGAADLYVSKLGRWKIAGNSQAHTVKLVAAGTGIDVPGGSVSISGGTAGSYVFAALASPLILLAGEAYYLVSSETNGGDQWEDRHAVGTATDVTVNNSVYYDTDYNVDSAGQSYGGVNLQYAKLDVMAEVQDGGNSVCFTPIPGGTSYAIQRATSVGGTYGTIATVMEGAVPQYLDASPSTPAFYRVRATIGGVLQAGTPGVGPDSLPTSGLGGGTIAASSPQLRENLLRDTSGYKAAVPNNLTWTQAYLAKFQKSPYGPFVVASEAFSSGLGALVNFTAGTGTAAAAGGHLTYTAAAQTTAAWRTAGTFVSPTAVVGVEVAAKSNLAFGVGLMTSLTDGLTVEYDSSASTLVVVGRTGGVSTIIGTIAAFAPAGAFKLAIEVLHNLIAIWADTGSGWDVVGGFRAAEGEAYDLRNTTTLANYHPTLYAFGATAGAWSADFTLFQATYFNGHGGTREMSAVTNLDGSQYVKDGLLWIGFDRSARTWGGTQDASTSYQIYPYDPATHTLGAPVVILSGTFAGVPAAAVEAKVVYDHNLDGFHIWSPNWTVLNTNVTRIFYAFVDRADFVGAVHVTFEEITVVSDTSDVIYGPDVIFLGSHWYMVVTEFVASPLHFRTRIVKGTAPDNFDTNVATDSTLDTEGTNFVRMGSRLYVVAGSAATYGGIWGWVNVFDFTDLTTLVPMGVLRFPNPMTGSAQPQQPGIIWYEDGAGLGCCQYFAYEDDNYQGEYQASGSLLIADADQKLVGWQFPKRTSQ